MAKLQLDRFDVRSRLPVAWQGEIRTVAAAQADFRDFPRTPVLSREASQVRMSPAAGFTPIRCGTDCHGSIVSTGMTFRVGQADAHGIRRSGP